MELTERDLIKNAFDEGFALGRAEAIHEMGKDIDPNYENFKQQCGPEVEDAVQN